MNKELLKKYNELYNQEERKQLTADMIKAFRETNKLQQKEVSELIGIKPQTYGAYESGRNETPLEVLVRLSILYNVPVDILIQRDNMAKDKKSALEQINYYDEQMQKLREDLLKGDNKAQEQFKEFIDELQKMNDILKDATDKIPTNEIK